MNKILITAAFAVAVIASGNAFADAGIDNAIYEETPSFASNNATVAMPSPAPMPTETAALYEETPSNPVVVARSADVGDQVADSGFGQFRGWTGTIQVAPATVAVPE